MAVPFADLGRDHAPIRDDLRRALDRVVDRGDFVLGSELELFEEEFARYVGVDHCVGVASGTAALTLALRAAGIGSGDEVIVPAHTYIASALGVVHAGARPVFCDVDDDRGLIDLDSAAAVVGPRTAAVLPVHLYGQLCDMDAVLAFADRHQLEIIEDAAQAHGASWRGRRAGSFGRASAFSFYPSKNLGALGDGGAICTDDAELAAFARRLRNLGQRSKGEHVDTGYNERLDTLQAAFLRVKLPCLDGWNARRRQIGGLYDGRLAASIGRLRPRRTAVDVFHLYPVRVADRDGLAQELAAQDIATGVHYWPALHRQPPFFSGPDVELPISERWAASVLSLPIFPGMTDEQVEAVCGAVNASAGAAVW